MWTVVLALNLACYWDPASDLTPQEREEASHVLVVENQASTDSVEIGNYYRDRRGVPKENVLVIQTVTTDNVPYADYVKDLEKPVREAVDRSKTRIDYVVLTKGVPLRIDNDGGWGVDAFLGAMKLGISPITKPEADQIKRSVNPFFLKDEPFASNKFGGMLLVTRLDGESVADAKKLVDDSLAAKPVKGPFFFDQAGNRTDGGYGAFNKALGDADASLRAAGFKSALETTGAFVAPSEALIGYTSWGSNDSGFSEDTYHKLKFLPGAIAETFVSTSARSFAKLSGGQSQITDLIAQGVTGVKGYVSEPYTFALANPQVLFDRYTKGYNLAESFSMASLVVKWKDVVVGDPLCRPFRK